MEIAALVIGIVALVVAVGFGIWQTLFNRRVEQQLLDRGETLLEVNWVWPEDISPVNCRAQARQIPLSKVFIGFGREQKSIGTLQAGETKTVDFINVSKGEFWTPAEGQSM